MKGDVLEIYLKKETICPLAGFLYRNNEAFDVQYDQAVERIVHLIKLLPKDELTEILKIEEPDTFKVSETSYRKELGR
jgi:hypothetical protein